MAVAGEEQGLVRLEPTAHAVQAGRHRHPGDAQQRHRRLEHGRRRHPRPAQRPALRQGMLDRRQPPTWQRSQVGGENDTPPRELARSSPRSPSRRGQGHGRPGDLPARPVPARRRPPAVPGAAATRRRRFTEPHENFDHEHQDVRVEDGVQIGDSRSSCDVDYVAGVARVNGAGLWSLAAAPRDAPRRQGGRHPADQQHHADLDRGRGGGRLRGGLEAHDRAVLDAPDTGREGRHARPSTSPRTTRCSASAIGRRGREALPRGVPPPRLTSCAVDSRSPCTSSR